MEEPMKQPPQEPPDDDLPTEFNVDQTIETWTRTMTLLVREVRMLKARVARLEGKHPVQQVGSA